MKKKLIGEIFLDREKVRKIWMTMRLIGLLFFVSLMHVSASVYSQRTKLNIKVENVSLQEIFKILQDQSEFDFFYKNEQIPADARVSINYQNQTVEVILDKILTGTGLSYHVLDKDIVISAKGTISNGMVSQQPKTISGKVTDSSGASLPGVSVVVKGTTNGTITDTNGNYSLTNVPENGTLQFSFVGMKMEEVTVAGQSSINITLAENVIGIDEVVAIGYGSTTKRATTASISTLNPEKLVLPVPTIGDALGGQVNGVFVRSSGGGPGRMPDINIRGGGNPLIVIDGIVSTMTDLQNFNPNDIENFSVLKDASAAAVYGARAGNGIIAVTTKRGVAGTMKINYDYSYTLSQPTILPKKLDSYTEVTTENEARNNDGQAPVYLAEVVQKYKDQSDPYNYPNTDWQKLFLNTFAPTSRHNLTINGGNEKTKYFASLSYLDQGCQYVFQTDWNKRYNYKVSLTNNFDKIGLVANVNLFGTMQTRREPFSSMTGNLQLPGDAGFVGGANTLGSTSANWGHLQARSATQLAYTDLGLYALTQQSPIVEVDPNSGYNLYETRYLTGILDLQWSVPGVKGLVIKAINQYRLDNDWYKSWSATAPMYPLSSDIPIPSTKPNLYVQAGQGNSYTNQFLGEYKKTFAQDHALNAMFGYEQSYGYNENVNGMRLAYILIRDQLSAGPPLNMTNGSRAAENARAGFIGRLGYDYKSRYLFEGSIRRDGSDWFPKDKRWGTFWSGSAGWNVSSESFMKTLDDKNIVNYLKLRASYGVVGLDGADAGISRFQYLQGYSANQLGYLINNLFVPTFTEGPLVSPDLTWYTQKSSNVGIDFATLNSKISGSFDYFFMETTGMLVSLSNVRYTDPLGTALPAVKSDGNLRRAGFEFTMAYKSNIGKDFQYTIGGNLSSYLKMWKNNPYEDMSVLKNPYTRSTYQTNYYGIGYKSLGYYTSADDVLNSPKLVSSTNLVPGDIKYQDRNGDGLIDANDQQHIGNDINPRILYGVTLDLKYKSWFLSSLVQGTGNRGIYPGNVIGDLRSYTFQLDYWTPENTNAKFPRLMSNPSYNNNNNNVRSDFWLENARYIRLKTLQIGYDFKRLLLRDIKFVSEGSLVIGGTNLVTLSPALRRYKIDPENGNYSSGGALIVNNNDYPMDRTYFLSVRVGF